MGNLIWSESSISDLNSIGGYIALDSEKAAKKFVQELIKKAELLVAYPAKGRLIPESIPGNYRQILHKSYRIIYRVYKKDVIISSVYHQKELLFKIKNK